MRHAGIAFALATPILLTACAQERASRAQDPFATEQPATVVHESGLIVEDVEMGRGDPVPPRSTVTVDFTAWLASGEEFDSTRARGGPVTWPLDRMIRGWREGVPGMRVGGTRRITVPSDMAYGAFGRPPSIPPDTDLTFEITLLSFERP